MTVRKMDNCHQDPSSGSTTELYNICITVATDVGAVLADYFSPLNKAKLMKSITTKTSPTDYATEADEKAEGRARQILRKLRPGDSVLGEEQGAPTGTTDLIWVIDPLDGTVNFVYGIDDFAVSVAVAERKNAENPDAAHGRVIAGAVYNPIKDELFSASVDQKPLLNGTEINVSNPKSLETSLVGTGFGYSRERRDRQSLSLAKILPRVRDIRRMGAASLDLCSVACGRLDAYYEVGLKPWDQAAGLLIAGAAGAKSSEIMTAEDGPLLLAAAPNVYEELLTTVKSSL